VTGCQDWRGFWKMCRWEQDSSSRGMYTDSHCHPENKRFDSDRPDVLARARAAKVNTLLAIGNGDGPGTGTFDCAIRLAEQYDGVSPTVGIPPHEAALAKQADLDALVQLAKRTTA